MIRCSTVKRGIPSFPYEERPRPEHNDENEDLLSKPEVRTDREFFQNVFYTIYAEVKLNCKLILQACYCKCVRIHKVLPVEEGLVTVSLLHLQ